MIEEDGVKIVKKGRRRDRERARYGVDVEGKEGRQE